LILPIGQEILWYTGLLSESEKTLPGIRPPRQNDISRRGILPDEDFLSFKPKIGWQANSLTPAVTE
jgi:hypothetical protein